MNMLNKIFFKWLLCEFALCVYVAIFEIVVDPFSLFGQKLIVGASQLHWRDTLDSRPAWCNDDVIHAMISEYYFSLPLHAPDTIKDVRLLAWSSDKITRSYSVKYRSLSLLYAVVYKPLNGRISVSLVVLCAYPKTGSDENIWQIAQYPQFGVYLDSTSPEYDRIPIYNRFYPIVPYLGGWHVPPSLLEPEDISNEPLWYYDGPDSTDDSIDVSPRVRILYENIETGSVNNGKLWMRSELLESPTPVQIDSFLTTPGRFYRTVPALRIIGLFEYGTFGTEECRYERIFEDGAVRERTWQYVFGFPPKEYLSNR